MRAVLQHEEAVAGGRIVESFSVTSIEVFPPHLAVIAGSILFHAIAARTPPLIIGDFITLSLKSESELENGNPFP